jgi:hypothetical protein
VNFFWPNILTHKSRWIVNWFHSLFIMNDRSLNVLSSSMEHKTWTMEISTNLMYSLNFLVKMTNECVFFHHLKTKFRLNYLVIITFALWVIVNLKIEDCTSSMSCESKRGGTIIPFIVLQTMQKKTLIMLKCKRNEPSTITRFNWYYLGYTMSHTKFSHGKWSSFIWIFIFDS